MLITIQEALPNNTDLLMGELAPIVQAIYNRLHWEMFSGVALFPVLMVSLSGPQHGRIIYGCFSLGCCR
ncbi:hypothetical protein BDW62DRAFT_180049 [Aspergillus aurantiobrunneus]